MPKAQITQVDPQTGLMSDGELSHGLGGSAFNIHGKRPWIEKGKVYINQVVGLDDKRQPIIKAVQVRANATLKRDEWLEIDKAVMKTARGRLIGIDDLQSRGLTYNLTNPMGKTILEYQDMNDPGEASMDMDADTLGNNDRPDFLTKYMPIPIIHSDFSISKRQLEASRSGGDAIDTVMVEASTRRVIEKAEDLLFTDTSYAYGGGTIYSYISTLTKNTVTLPLAWDDGSKTGALILADIQNMKKASIAANHFGPWVVYIPTDYETVMDDDYTAGYPKSIRQRCMEIEGIEAIRVADRLPDDKVVMVEMDTSTVRLINGFAPTVLQWEGMGGLVNHFKVMMIQVPQIRADQAGNSGLTVLQL